MSPTVFAAAKGGDTDALRVLVAEDAADVCHAVDTDGSGQTALHWAAFYGHVDAVRLLLEHGADADARGADSATALHRAAESGHAEVVRVLLNSGATPSAVDDDGRTALTRCAMLGAAQQLQAGGHAEVLGVLLGHGCAAPRELVIQERVLHWLAAVGNLEVLRTVLSSCNDDTGSVLEARDRQGRTALAAAAKAGQTDCCAALLQAGASLDSLDKAGASPYLCACFSGKAACEAALAAAGAATDVCDKFGNDAQAYRARNLRRSNSPPVEAPAAFAEVPAGRPGPTCCRRLLCCWRRNRVQDDSLERPLAASGTSS
jgi:ankyrin repeat protein